MIRYFVSNCILILLLFVAMYSQIPYLSATLAVVLFLWYLFILFVSFTLMLLALGKIKRVDPEHKQKDEKLLLKAGRLNLQNYWIKEIMCAVFSILQILMISFNPTYSSFISITLLLPLVMLIICSTVFKNETINIVNSLEEETNGSK
jgi:hypothetical protein